MRNLRSEKNESLKEAVDGNERAIATCSIAFDTREASTLNIQISEEDLRDHFCDHGEIAAVQMIHDKEASNACKRAFVESTTGRAANFAITTMDKLPGQKFFVFFTFA